MEGALPELPQPDVEPDEDGWLFDSNRDDLEQLACYQAHQNGTGDDPPESRTAAA